MPERISKATASSLSDRITHPQYIPEDHGTGIVHIGIGAFHRAHQAVFTDDTLANDGGDWRITAISLRSGKVSELMNPQDGLYTVTEMSEDVDRTRLIGAIERVLVAPENPGAVIKTLSDKSTKVVTLTVTEKGYHYDRHLDAIDLSSPDITHDIENPEHPVSMPGFLVAACRQRMQNDSGNLSVVSCDNLPENGRVTRAVVLSLANKTDPALATWIDSHVNFCSSMVDRIVPAVKPEDLQAFESKYGIEDQALVTTEPFKQWVIEDNFCTDRPRWEIAGALVVSDVTVYEKMKLRLLNGSHSALAYMGVLSGYTYIYDAVADPILFKIVAAMMKKEIETTLTPPMSFDLSQYQETILRRFANPHIPYATHQVATDGSQKIPQRLLQPAAEYIDKTGQVPILIVSMIACWIRFLRGADDSDHKYDISDPLIDVLGRIVSEQTHDSEKLISSFYQETHIFPEQLKQNDAFNALLIQQLDNMNEFGVKNYLTQLSEGTNIS